jgi:hypothetical protein
MKKIMLLTFMTLLLSTFASADYDDGLLVYFPFNNTLDNYGSFPTGLTNYGAVLGVGADDGVDSAYDFDRTENDYMKWNNTFDEILNLSGDYSVIFWSKTGEQRDMNPFSTQANGQITVQLEDYAGNFVITLIVSDNTGNQLLLRGNRNMNENVYNHIAVTKEGDTYKTYLNGVLDRSGSKTFDMSRLNNLPELVFGRSAEDLLVYHYNGSLDDFRLSNSSCFDDPDCMPPNPPNITATNPSQSLELSFGTEQVFSVTSNQVVDYLWYLDEVLQTENSDSYTYTSAIEEVGNHTLEVVVFNENGQDEYEWFITNVAGYNNLYEAEETSEVAIDFVTGLLIFFGSVATIIAVVFIIYYVRGKRIDEWWK